MSLGISKTVQGSFEEVEQKVRDSLDAQGFGVLSSFNLAEKFKNMLDIDFRNYKVLGACNPAFAHKALSISDDVGLLVPCNVTLDQVGQNEVKVTAIDPAKMMEFINDQRLQEIVPQVRNALATAIEEL